MAKLEEWDFFDKPLKKPEMYQITMRRMKILLGFSILVPLFMLLAGMAAGIVHVNSAGNSGTNPDRPVPYTMPRPLLQSGAPPTLLFPGDHRYAGQDAAGDGPLDCVELVEGHWRRVRS